MISNPPPLHSASGISDDGPLAETQVFHYAGELIGENL